MNSLPGMRILATDCERRFQIAQAVQFVEHVQRQCEVDVVQVAERANVALVELEADAAAADRLLRCFSIAGEMSIPVML